MSNSRKMLVSELRPPPPDRLLKPRREPTHKVDPATKPEVCTTGRTEGQTFGQFFTATTVSASGVLASFPKSVLDEASPHSRLIGLDRTRNVGHAAWWTRKLVKAKYDYTSSYTAGNCFVYSTDGLESNEWFPRHTCMDTRIKEASFDYLTLGGFSVVVRACTPKQARESGLVTHRFALEMEAAASGVAPAIIAGFLVNDPRVLGKVMVTQRHVFRLSDLLKEYNRFLNNDLLRPGIGSIDGSVYEMTAAIARRVRAVANARLLKMNMVPSNVVFCPHLVEDDDGNMMSAGYGFGRLELKGVPHLTDFDPAHMKRGGEDFNADAAYCVMMAQLLTTIRAEYGNVYGIFLNKLTGKSPSGVMLPEAELPERFEAIDVRKAAAAALTQTASVQCILETMPGYNRTSKLVKAYDQAKTDVPDAIQALLVSCDRPVFQQLASHHLQTIDPETSLSPVQQSSAATVGSALSSIAERLQAVRLAREAERQQAFEER